MSNYCPCVEVNKTKAFVGAWVSVGLTLVTITALIGATVIVVNGMNTARDIEMSKSGMVQKLAKADVGEDRVVWVKEIK